MTQLLNLRTLGLVLLLSSCAGDGSELDSTGVPLSPPEIEADRSTVELSLVEGTSTTSSFAITNVGGFPLEIEAVVAAEEFLHPLFEGPVTVGKDQSHEILFRVDALAVEDAPYTGTVHVSSNADLVPNLSVSVLLDVTPAPEPEISVSSDTLRVMIVEGEIDTVTFEIVNSGSADLVVSRFVSDLEQMVPPPQELTIEPGNSAVVPLQIDARQSVPGLLQGTLEIHSNDEDEAILRITTRITVELSGPFPATLTAIQANVFDVSCTLAGCHSEPPSLGLRLTPGASWKNLYEMPSFFVPEMFLVKPFDSDNSFLITKLVEVDKRRISERMPIGDLPYLDDSVIDVIRRWIDEGALDN